jgi:hypothetical protein
MNLGRLGRNIVLALVALIAAVWLYDLLFPAQPSGRQSSITRHGDKICTAASPSDELMEKLRVMGANGATSKDLTDYMNRELADAPPLCVELARPD